MDESSYSYNNELCIRALLQKGKIERSFNLIDVFILLVFMLLVQLKERESLNMKLHQHFVCVCVFKYLEVMQNTKLMTASVFHGNLSPYKFCFYTDGLLMVIKLQLGKCKHTEASLPFLCQHAFHLIAAQFNSPYGIRTVSGFCTHIGSLHGKKALVM